MSDPTLRDAAANLRNCAAEGSDDPGYVELLEAAAELLKAIDDTRPVCPAGVVSAAERFAVASLAEEL